MSAKTLTEIFNNEFKFEVGQRVRHKGDMKEHSYSSNDVGLLVLSRLFVQEMTSDGLKFDRIYNCRMIAFSGSGQVLVVKESEIQSIEEWQREAVSADVEREMRKRDIEQLQSDIMTQFGVTKNSRVLLKGDDGQFDETKIYRPCGFQSNKETGRYELFIRLTNTLDTDTKSITVSSAEQIKDINTPEAPSK